MASIEYDGIYGESDHWLSEEEVTAAEKATQLEMERPRGRIDDAIVDLHAQRAKPRR
jgi:hypothetical protein